MMSKQMIWLNGKFIPGSEAKVHVLSHSLHYGGSAFEGIRFYETAQGPAIFRLSDHIDRLFHSAKVLKIPLVYSKDEITAAVIDLVHRSKLKSGYIRPIIFYGYQNMRLNPVGNPVECAIACWPWGAYLPHESVDVKTSSYMRIHPDSTVVDAKLSGHYVNSILASLELQGTHYHEALFLDSERYISEGVGENFFMVKAGVIYTPKLGSILPGITRDTVIQIAHRSNFEILETNITLDDAYHADEAFFTGTAAEITPIRSLDDKVLGNGEIGAITSTIKEKYLNVVKGKIPEFNNYLSYVEKGQIFDTC